ncbi:MAG: hypothetical protein ACC655_04665 [Rhodothermia bacterium]
MRVFVDNSISASLAEVMRVHTQGFHTVCHLKDVLDQSTDDVAWIEYIRWRSNEEGEPWYILTADLRIRRNRKERQALVESGLTAFFTFARFSELTGPQQISLMQKWWPKMSIEAARYPIGTIFDLHERAAKPSIWRFPPEQAGASCASTRS